MIKTAEKYLVELLDEHFKRRDLLKESKYKSFLLVAEELCKKDIVQGTKKVKK